MSKISKKILKEEFKDDDYDAYQIIKIDNFLLFLTYYRLKIITENRFDIEN